MRYLKTFESFTSLLDMDETVDQGMISEIKSLIGESGKILEVSCGNGSDAKHLSKLGYDVICTENHKPYFDHVSKDVNCIMHDTKDKFPFEDNQFDLIYSRLGLHYFSKEELSSIFSELNRMTNGYLVFSVKLLDDSIKTNKVILSKSDWESIVMDSQFDIVKSEVKSGELYGFPSRWLEITASKINI